MARSALDSALVPAQEHGNLLGELVLGEETVTLEAVPDHSNEERAIRREENNSLFITNQNVSLSDYVSDKPLNADEIVVSDELIVQDNSSTNSMNNSEMINLLMSQRKQEEEEVGLKDPPPPMSYTCSVQSTDEHLENEAEDLQTEEIDGKKTEENSETPVLSAPKSPEASNSNNTYYTIDNSAIPSQLAPGGTYEVTTFVTEDGQTGQIIISGSGNFSPDTSASNILNLNSASAAIQSNGQVLSLGEAALEQIASLNNISSNAIQLTTGQNDEGDPQIQYVIKQEENIQSESDSAMMRKMYQCSMAGCCKQFSTPSRLKAHKRVHSGDTFTCNEELCSKTFITQSDLQKHIKTHLGQKDYVCEFEGCGKEYTTIHHLKVHKRQHSGERPFVCEWEGCGKMFTTGYGLKSHFRTHTNERPYKCQHPTCSKAFKTSGDLQKHIRTHTGERPFVCPYSSCGRSFTTSNIRKVHLRTHTGEKPYKCEIETCGRTFASATNYKNHSRIHTGERPYVCEVPGCMRRFTEYSSLYKHNIVHTQSKPYTCTICSKNYRQTSTLAMHKRTVHGTEDLTDAERTSRKVQHPIKRPKISQRHRMTPVTSTSTTTQTNYLQGMSLVINNATATGIETTFAAELAAAQQLTESSEIPGAIAIPIQVTMNPDGTIAGAQGLNLTDGSGRMIPVNLSVSIPMSSLEQLNDNASGGKQHLHSGGIIEMIADTMTEVAPRENKGDSDNISEEGNTQNHHENVTVSILSNATCQSNLDEQSYDIDTDERDVTDKYLTSHYRKEIKPEMS